MDDQPGRYTEEYQYIPSNLRAPIESSIPSSDLIITRLQEVSTQNPPPMEDPSGGFWRSLGNIARQSLPYVAQGLNAWSQAEAQAAQAYNQMSYTPLHSTRKPSSVVTKQGKTIPALQPKEFKQHRLMADSLASRNQYDAEQAMQHWQNTYQRPSVPMNQVTQVGLPQPGASSGRYSQNPGGGDVMAQQNPNMRAILDPAFNEQPAPKLPEAPPIRLSHREKSDYQEAKEIARRLRFSQREPDYYERLMLKRGTDVAQKVQGTQRSVKQTSDTRQQDWQQPQAFRTGTIKSRAEVIRDGLFNDPKSTQTLLEELENSALVDDAKFEQIDMNLANLVQQKQVSPQEAQALKVGMRSLMTRHWLTHEVDYTNKGTAIYRGVEMPAQVAPHVVYSDAKHFTETYQHLSHKKLEQAAKDFTQALLKGSQAALKLAYDLWIGDDIKTLTDPNANLFWKAVAGASLLSNFVPAGLVGKVGNKVLGKITGKVSSKVLTRLGEFLEKKGIQHLGDIPQNTGDLTNDVQKLELVRDRLKKELNLHDLPDEHEIMRELQGRHTKSQAWSGRAAATEVYIAPDKQSVIFRTRVNKSHKIEESELEEGFAIWTSAIEKNSNGKVLLRGHENYEIIGKSTDGKIQARFLKYREDIPGGKAPLGEQVLQRIERQSKQPAIKVEIDLQEDLTPTKEIVGRLQKRWDTFVFKRGDY